MTITDRALYLHVVQDRRGKIVDVKFERTPDAKADRKNDTIFPICRVVRPSMMNGNRVVSDPDVWTFNQLLLKVLAGFLVQTKLTEDQRQILRQIAPELENLLQS